MEILHHPLATPTILHNPYYSVMAEEPNVISTIRLARWLMLALLLVGGIVLYFRNGNKLPPFGSVEPSAETDTTR